MSAFFFTTPSLQIYIAIFWEGGPPTDIADRVNASYPHDLLRLMHQRVTKETAEADKCVTGYFSRHLTERRSRELLDGLHKRGFKTTLGDDDAGFLLMAWSKGGGYYLGWSFHLRAGVSLY